MSYYFKLVFWVVGCHISTKNLKLKNKLILVWIETEFAFMSNLGFLVPYTFYAPNNPQISLLRFCKSNLFSYSQTLIRFNSQSVSVSIVGSVWNYFRLFQFQTHIRFDSKPYCEHEFNVEPQLWSCEGLSHILQLWMAHPIEDLADK